MSLADLHLRWSVDKFVTSLTGVPGSVVLSVGNLWGRPRTRSCGIFVGLVRALNRPGYWRAVVQLVHVIPAPDYGWQGLAWWIWRGRIAALAPGVGHDAVV